MGFGKSLPVEYNDALVGLINEAGFSPVTIPFKFNVNNGFFNIYHNDKETTVWLMLPNSWGNIGASRIFIGRHLNNEESCFEDVYMNFEREFIRVYKYSQYVNSLVTSIFVDNSYWGIAIPKYLHSNVLCIPIDDGSGINTFAKYGRKIDICTDEAKRFDDDSATAFLMGDGNFCGTLYIDDHPMFHANMDVWYKDLNIETIVECLFYKVAVSEAQLEMQNDEVKVVNKHFDDYFLYGYSIDRGLRLIRKASKFVYQNYFSQPFLLIKDEFFFGNIRQSVNSVKSKEIMLDATTIEEAVIELAEIIDKIDPSQPHATDYNQLFGANQYVNKWSTEFGRTLYNHFIKMGF